MKRTDRPRNYKHSTFSTIATGTLISGTVSVLLSAIIATLAVNDYIPESSIMYTTYLIFMIAILSGVLFSVNIVEGKKIIKAAAVSLCFWALAFSINIIFFDGVFRKIIVYLLMVIFAIGVSCIKKTKKNRSKVMKKLGYR